MAYERPQVTVDQNLTMAPTSVERDQPAFIFGPNYHLHRYTSDAEKANTKIGTWEGSALAGVEYPHVVDPANVDKSYTRLYGDNVVAQLFDLGSASFPEAGADSQSSAGVSVETINENGGFTRILFDGKKYVAWDDSTKAEVELETGLARSVRVGDVLSLTYSDGGTSTTVVTTVVKAEYHSVAWSLDGDPYEEVEPGTLVTLADPIPVTAESAEAKLCEILQGVEFTRKNYKTPGTYQWQESVTAGEPTVDVSSLAVLIGDFGDDPVYCDVLFADLYLSYRELVTAFSDAIHSVQDSSGVEDLLGAIDKDNPLAMGVYMACINAVSDDGDEAPPVYFMATPTDDDDGYAEVLKRATLTDRVYALAPVSRDPDVIEMVRSHVEKMSSKSIKHWRIAAVSAAVPESVQKLGPATDIDGRGYFAVPVSAVAGTSYEEGESYTMIRVTASATDDSPNSDTRFRSTVVKKDVIRFAYDEDAWGDETFQEFVVDRVVNNNTLKIVGEIGADVIADLPKQDGKFKPTPVEVYHVYSSAERAGVVASTSKALDARRVVNVFPPTFQHSGTTLTGEFGACAVAGRVSSCEPQQPMTNLTIRGIDDVPATYQDYSAEELDVMAAGGTFIIAQDLPGDKVYVRHQITTAYPDGNLNTAELSITRDVDSVSYAFADVFEPYVGKYNITDDLLASYRSLASTLLGRLETSDSVYGPQLIEQGTEILYIRQNELLKDHVDIGVRLAVPYPCNNIDISLTV